MTSQPAGQQTDDIAVMMSAIAASLVASNYPAPQAKIVLDAVAANYGTQVDVEMMPTMVLSQSRGQGHTTLRTIRTSFRFDQMMAAQEVIARARHSSPVPSDVTAALVKIQNLPPKYPSWLRVIGYALSALGFAACFQFDLLALIGATAMGLVIGVLVLYGSKIQGLGALLPFVATLLAGLMVAGFSVITGSLDPVRLVAVGVVVLLPGAVLTSGIIELVSGYMMSGAARLIYALMILGTMAFGFALSLELSGLGGARLEDLTGHLTPLWVAWVGAAIFGVGTFLYFCTPLRLWIPSLVVMIVSFFISMVVPSGMGAAIAAGCATFFGLVISWIINARMGGGPGDFVIFLPTFWLIVPGSAGFVLIAGGIEASTALTAVGGQAALTFMAMAIGLMLAGTVNPLISKIGPNVGYVLRRGVEFLPERIEKVHRRARANSVKS